MLVAPRQSRGAPRRCDSFTPSDMAGRAPSPRPRTRSRAGLRFAVVAARFNEPITKRLLDGALHALDASGVAARDLEVYWVPGAFELPQAALYLAPTRRFAAIVCVGGVIRGPTPHFDFVAGPGPPGRPRVPSWPGRPH